MDCDALRLALEREDAGLLAARPVFRGQAAALRNGKDINGKRLFGDQGGAFANGYDKLATLNANRDGKLTGKELEGLKV